MIKVVNGGLLVKRAYTTEIDFTVNLSAGATVNFSDVQELRDILVFGIEIFPSEALTNSKNGNACVSTAICTSLLMSFFDFSLEKIKWEPATAYIANLNGGSFRMYDALKLNLTKSMVIATANVPTANLALVVSFYYLDIKKDLPKRVTAAKK